MILVLFGLFLGNASQMQIKYDKCKTVNFETKVCSFEKALNSIKK